MQMGAMKAGCAQKFRSLSAINLSLYLRLAGLGLSLLIGATASADTALKRVDLNSYDAFIDVPQSWSYARYRPNFETLGHTFSDPKSGRKRLRIIIAPADVIDSKFLSQSATRSCVHGLVHLRSHDRGNAVDIVLGIDDDADADVAPNGIPFIER